MFSKGDKFRCFKIIPFGGERGTAMVTFALNMILAYAKRTGRKVISNFSLKREYRTFTKADLTIKLDELVDTSKGYLLIDDFSSWIKHRR